MDFVHKASRWIIQFVYISCLSIPLFLISFSIRETAPFAFSIIAGATSVITPLMLFSLNKISMICLIASNILTPVVISFSNIKICIYSSYKHSNLCSISEVGTIIYGMEKSSNCCARFCNDSLISEAKLSIRRVTVRAERLMSAKRSLFSGHTISATVKRQSFTNSPSMNGFFLFPISSQTAKLARVLLSDSVLCLMKVPCCSVNDLRWDSILFFGDHQ